MILKKFTLGPIEANNYLLIDEEEVNGSKEAVLIDCTQDCKEIDDTLKKYGANLKYILITHGHFDHVLGINSFKAKYNCEVLIHEEDKIILDKMNEYTTRFGLGEFEVQQVDGFVKENDLIEFGKNKIKVIHTPGHSRGCVCYLLGDKVFTGDTLFYESVGRTDLPGGSFSQIKASIKEKLFTLEESTKVYPGHGWESTIGHEKVNNRFQ